MLIDAMRTTLTLDDQLLRQLRARAASSGKPFRQVVHEVLRAGLAGELEDEALAEKLRQGR